MRRVRLPLLPTAAVLCGAALVGWSAGGIASMDGDLQRAVTQQPRQRQSEPQLVVDPIQDPHARPCRRHDL